MSLFEIFYKKNKRRCPSCLELIYPGDCEIVGEIPQNVILMKAPRGLKKEWARFYPKRLAGTKMARRLPHRKCPKCGYPLPYNIELARSLNIAVVGGNRAGKSHYIAAIIKGIGEGKIVNMNQSWRMRCLTPEVLRKYKTNVFDPVNVSLQALSPSASYFDTASDPQNTTHEPLIYELSLRLSDDILPSLLNLIIYDTAGEDYMHDDRLVQSARYVLSADALIFVADPVSMPGLYQEIRARYSSTPNLEIGTPLEDPVAAFTAIISMIEFERGSRPGAKLKSLPIAIMLSKSDLLEKFNSYRDQFYFLKEPAYNGGIDMTDIGHVNTAVREVLIKYKEEGLIKASHDLQCKSFFATSATGQPPEKKPSSQSAMFSAIRPLRCLDPILWILYQLGYINDVNSPDTGW